ncbi:zinc-dependent metalloprotease [Halegenticoccus tardaugens]|uniref:zinc-dependent metalloprotease n=1 Tax=Halegenticoccus tardaugens TaxID=2071624 RepID=UPI00100A7C9D|nr:zinc-dependent metalloprotease [Halegenticoccus tardaugens]
MNIYRSVRAVTEASGTGVVDWDAVAEAAKAATDPGSIDLAPEERAGYAADVRDARSRLRSVAAVEFDLPRTIEVQNRHHWIDANIRTFERVMRPIERRGAGVFPDVARVVNTGTMAFMLSFLGNNVLGQYDPLLLAEGDEDHGLYFVRPNIRKVADSLDVDYPRFRRWIAFHEVSHAAEFGAAPWLSSYLEARMEEGVDALAEGSLDRDAFRELDTAMTAVEGYAELLMDRAFDDDYSDLRRKLDARRRGGGPLAQLVRRILGLGLKRRQYERGAAFFEAVADARGVAAASRVWERPENLPTNDELDHPERWLDRVA